MRCIVTAGPTYEPLDQVRRLTNSSTGRLGSELANHLSKLGHEVTLFIGEQATYRGELRAARVISFSSTGDLARQIEKHAGNPIRACFHAAAVSDFSFGHVWVRSSAGELQPIQAGKYSTREGTLLVELHPTQKIIRRLRDWFPSAILVGWKYEVDGTREDVVARGNKQLEENRTNACVLNGPAYGAGFGLLKDNEPFDHLENAALLYNRLAQLLESGR